MIAAAQLSRALALIAALACLVALGSSARAQMFQCPAGSTPVAGGGGMMCQCADGSYASIYGCAAQAQPPAQPVGELCASGASCPEGTYCSRLNASACVPNGRVDCGDYNCGAGERCGKSNRMCVAAGAVDCGNHVCPSGYYCASQNKCFENGQVDCGNGTFCAAGRKCSLDAKHCLEPSTVDCGSHFCNEGMKCGSGDVCLVADAIDCGGGRSCPGGQICRRGGGCATAEELAAEKVQAELEARAAAERRRAEVEEKRKRAAEEAAAAEKKRQEEAAAQKAEQERQADEKRRQAEEKQRREAEAQAAELKRRDAIRASVSALRLTARPSWTLPRLRQARPLPQAVLPPEIAERILGKRLETPSAPLAIGEAALNLAVRPSQNYGPAESTPLRWAGRLAFTGHDGDAYCSAQFIAPRILLTAAHCVRDEVGGAYHSNIAFALQYNGGVFSQLYSPLCAATPQGWVQDSPEKWRWDYALILTDAPSRTGYFGWALGAPAVDQRATAIGYPHDMADGEVIQVEAAAVELFDGVIALKIADAAFGKGSSGGARILKYDTQGTGGANVAFSVNSYIALNMPGYSFGPVLGEHFKNMFEYVSNGCKD